MKITAIWSKSQVNEEFQPPLKIILSRIFVCFPGAVWASAITGIRIVSIHLFVFETVISYAKLWLNVTLQCLTTETCISEKFYVGAVV